MRFAQVVIGPVVPGIIGAFDISRGTVGAALTGMWFAYALAQLPSGVLADRIGEKRVILVALATTGSAALLLAVAPTTLFFGLGAIVLGLGAGIYYNPATALLSREFDRIGRAIGTHRVGGQIAGVAAPAAAAVAAVRYGWRPTVALGAVLAVVAAVVVASRVPPTAPGRPEASLRDLFALGDLAALLARPHTRFTTALATLVEFVGLAAMAFLPTLLIEGFGLSPGRANAFFAVFFATAALSQPFGGWLSDRIGRDGTLVLLASSGAAGYTALSVGETALVAALAVVLAGASMSATPVVQSRMLDGLSATDRGTGFGLFRTLYLAVGAMGTTVVGTTADVAGWDAAAVLLAAPLVAIVLAVTLSGGIRRVRGST